MPDEGEVRAIVRAVAAYLYANPHACDTAEGIRRWWLSADLECTQESMALALDWMKRQNLVEMTTAADGRQRFSRAGGTEELEALLRTSAGGK